MFKWNKGFYSFSYDCYVIFYQKPFGKQWIYKLLLRQLGTYVFGFVLLVSVIIAFAVAATIDIKIENLIHNFTFC